ncbi:hypothetical protein N7509_009376 [Penicillium cosmopolitanum]|uniref:Ketoreductase domain-containing protein n=1 Tax=Penicillium cosmopolitanum TaxID=1131564 RepID=A0A9W9VPD9_9EURO|nr:uncharacterized protein N7509_009376 [Penicillium cosmopolitanum]KAJ5386835.1 hypothetical protein N7509_009376 [Penicillium cosmopolitanum]
MAADILNSKKVLISGGTGFVGSATVRALAARHPGCAITVIDRSPPRAEHALPKTIQCMQVDVASAEEVNRALQIVKPNIIVHAAGIIPSVVDRFSRRLEREVWKTNVEGTRNMLSGALENDVDAFIYTSSCCVVTDDLSTPYCNIDEEWPVSHTSLIYGESKAAAEALVLEADSSQMASCSLRPSVLCGEEDYLLVPTIHACIAKYETPFIIGDGQNLWDVTHVSNVADAHILAMENLMTSRTAAGEAFFIQNNEPITFRDFCLAIWSHFGHNPPFELRIPETLAYVAGFLCEMLTWVTGTSTTLSRGSVRDACAVRYASGEKAKAILGYEARIGMEDAIRLSCEEYARRIGVVLPARR